MVIIKTSKQINAIRKSCEIVAYVLSILEKTIAPGVTTKYLNDLAVQLCKDKGAIPAFEGYRGFPYAICASKNEEVVHGFPDESPLKDGDILSVDFGAIYNGWYGDSAFTKGVGDIEEHADKLIKTTKECLYKGIEQAVAGNRLGDIGFAIQRKAIWSGYNVVKEFVGHGIGKNLHEDPQVPNYGTKGEGLMLKPGIVIAIEPMVSSGSADVHTLPDGWTTITKDYKLAAHYEHTIAITENGPEILTNRD